MRAWLGQQTLGKRRPCWLSPPHRNAWTGTANVETIVFRVLYRKKIRNNYFSLEFWKKIFAVFMKKLIKCFTNNLGTVLMRKKINKYKKMRKHFFVKVFVKTTKVKTFISTLGTVFTQNKQLVHFSITFRRFLKLIQKSLFFVFFL